VKQDRKKKFMKVTAGENASGRKGRRCEEEDPKQ